MWDNCCYSSIFYSDFLLCSFNIISASAQFVGNIFSPKWQSLLLPFVNQYATRNCEVWRKWNDTNTHTSVTGHPVSMPAPDRRISQYRLKKVKRSSRWRWFERKSFQTMTRRLMSEVREVDTNLLNSQLIITFYTYNSSWVCVFATQLWVRLSRLKFVSHFLEPVVEHTLWVVTKSSTLALLTILSRLATIAAGDVNETQHTTQCSTRCDAAARDKPFC